MKLTTEAKLLLEGLQARFESHSHRHPNTRWEDVRALLQDAPKIFKTVTAMEESGGEPDIVEWTSEGGRLGFVDCSPETPSGRRSLCFDELALEARKKNKPQGSVEGIANAIGISLLTEAQYRFLQTLGEFDLKTSSWIATPPDIRRLGGALFCDRRYDHVFTYHNGADSYYASRAFRGVYFLD